MYLLMVLAHSNNNSNPVSVLQYLSGVQRDCGSTGADPGVHNESFPRVHILSPSQNIIQIMHIWSTR